MIPGIVTRLADLIPGQAAEVADAAALALLAPGALPAALPALFVVPVMERAGPLEGLNGARQRVEATVGIIFVVSAGDPGGAVATLESLRAQVESRLLGWQPSPDQDSLRLGGGELVAAEAGTLWWQDDYRTLSFKAKI
ncbi:MAG: hypothetical protein K2Q10_06560 [Rhodospirillales bacterium]|nr:hypothetical protein [Rhodospirillales bacterium]